MKFNTTQQIILILSGLSIIAMILFPPTKFTSHYRYKTNEIEVFSGYKFIGYFDKSIKDQNKKTTYPSVIDNRERYSSIYSIESTRLTFQILAVILSSVFFIYAFKIEEPDTKNITNYTKPSE